LVSMEVLRAEPGDEVLVVAWWRTARPSMRVAQRGILYTIRTSSAPADVEKTEIRGLSLEEL
jgi:hypothetical protein